MAAYGTPGDAVGVSTHGSYVYVACGGSGFEILEVGGFPTSMPTGQPSSAPSSKPLNVESDSFNLKSNNSLMIILGMLAVIALLFGVVALPLWVLFSFKKNHTIGAGTVCMIEDDESNRRSAREDSALQPNSQSEETTVCQKTIITCSIAVEDEIKF
jgi:hypothetical protein